MQMTESEIVRKYKENRKTKGYVAILAQLNSCSKQEINDILRKNGVELPGNPNFVKPKAKLDQDKIQEAKEEKKKDDMVGEVKDLVADKDANKAVIDSIKQAVEECAANHTFGEYTCPDSVKEILIAEYNRCKDEADRLMKRMLEISDFLAQFDKN
jgi:hypothetical protein